MRGKEGARNEHLWTGRITPAHAGKRPSAFILCEYLWDHPRACGEKASLNARIAVPSGSPPRMRGKAPFLRRSGLTAGITPAHAGKRHEHTAKSTTSGDHPRACGEKFFIVCHCNEDHGITPAHAGKRSTAFATTSQSRDHPRACGEKMLLCCPVPARSGSPPRMRGKVKTT